MRKKLALIFALGVLFAAVLVFRPWEMGSKDAPRFFDRLPDADLIGKADILELSETFKSTTYYFKVPYREFLTREFILQQAKSFGIDVQKPAYFFANEKDWELEDFGAMLLVKDSTIVHAGMARLGKLIPFKDTLVYNKKVYKNTQANVYIAYGSDWMLLYNGKNFKRTFHDVLFAKKNEIPPNWRAFLNKAKFNGSPVVAQLTTKALEGYGITSMNFRVTNDSTSITLNSSIQQKDSVAIKLKPSGPAYEMQSFTKTLVNLHLDITQLRDRPNDPLVRLLKDIASKISFPVDDFLMAWNGDLAFRQGGLQSYQEQYIESSLDDNFNVTEVTKYKTIKVPGYSAYFSMTPQYTNFLNRLTAKGILTKPDKRYRLLFSPPMEMHKSKLAVALYTATYYQPPKTSSENIIKFTKDRTQYTFSLDSINRYTYYCHLRIPLKQIVQDQLPQR